MDKYQLKKIECAPVAMNFSDLAKAVMKSSLTLMVPLCLPACAGVDFITASDAPNAPIFEVKPVKPIPDLLTSALAAHPPEEKGTFRRTELVELTTLDASLKLDIRYASTHNFLGTPLYSQARAFLQRPAAQALIRAHKALANKGYGLLIFDAYRPWYITKIFWDAVPVAMRKFVADPGQGSSHNRGCAVDLTLYELNTGRPVAMTSLFDEFTERAFADYPGGTDKQHQRRNLLRQTMQGEGFTVYEYEWWHFDYRDGESYAIENRRFEDIGNTVLD